MEIKVDYKINWLNEFTGLITLQGAYNYLVFNETEFYFMSPARVVDIEKQIFVYSITKDHWQTFISRTDNVVKGYLTKTNNYNLLAANLQRTKAAITEVNSQSVFAVCDESKCDESYSEALVNTIEFKKNEFDEIIQFGSIYRVLENDFNAFVDKLEVGDYEDDIEPNKIISYCKFRKVPQWKNYVAGLVEKFFNTDSLALTLSTATNLNSISGKLESTIKASSDAIENIHIITKTNPKHKVHGKVKVFETILTSGEVKNKKVNDIDLTQITDIRQLDLNDLTEINLYNKNIASFEDDGKKVGIEKNNQTWYLKAKMYGDGTDAKSFRHLPMSNKVYKQKYTLDAQLLETLNLMSIEPGFNKQGFNFANTLVPAIYYPTWKDSIDNQTILDIFKIGDYSTEVGFLLNNINDYENKCVKNISNKHIYNGLPLSITTGIRLSDVVLTCDYIKKLSDDSLVKDVVKQVSFSEIYREDIEQSLWLALLNSYLWWGQLGRPFVGLSKNTIADEFIITRSQCYLDSSQRVWDSKLYNAQDTEDNADKLPSFLIDKISPKSNLDDFKKALKTITDRRREIEITEPTHPDIETGDIFWSVGSYGLFPKSGVEYISKKELNIDGPALVIYQDKHYAYNSQGRNYTSTLADDDKKFKIGLLNIYKPKSKVSVTDNIITTDGEEVPPIYYVKPLLYLHDEAKTDLGLDYDLFATNFEELIKKRHWRTSTHDSVLIYYDNVWSHFSAAKVNARDFTVENHWPRKKDDTYAMILRVGGKSGYYTLFLEEGKEVIIWFANELHYGFWYEIIPQKFLRHHFQKTLSKEINSFTSWNSLPEIKTNLLDTTNLYIKKALASVYELINYETLDRTNFKYNAVSQEDLRDGQNKLFVFERGGIPYFYVLLKWHHNKNYPTIEIVIADPNIIDDKPQTKYKLRPTAALTTTNMAQAVNQQNFLYVHGRTFPIKTKIVTIAGDINFSFKVDTLNVSDKVSESYRLFFSGPGGDFINETITIIKKEISETFGTNNLMELARLKIDLNESAENRKLALAENQEKIRLNNLNTRNQKEDLVLEDSLFRQGQANKFISGMASTVLAAAYNPAGALISGISSVVNTMHETKVREHRTQVTERNIRQQEEQNAIQHELDSNRLTISHKANEMREQNRIYEMTNIVISSTPNNANMLEAVQKLDTGGADIAILNRMPVGELLEMLTDYHNNWGYDIVLNNYTLGVKSFGLYDNQIYQFNRIDSISIDNIAEKEIIKGLFENGVYLTKYKYQLNISNAQQQRKEHNAKIAKIALEKKNKEKAVEASRIADLKIKEKVRIEAELNHKQTLALVDTYKDELNRLASLAAEEHGELTILQDKLKVYENLFKNEIKLEEEDKAEIQRITEENLGLQQNLNSTEAELKIIKQQIETITATSKEALDKAISEHEAAILLLNKQVEDNKKAADTQHKKEVNDIKRDCQREKVKAADIQNKAIEALETKHAEELKTRNDTINNLLDQNAQLEKEKAENEKICNDNLLDTIKDHAQEIKEKDEVITNLQTQLQTLNTNLEEANKSLLARPDASADVARLTREKIALQNNLTTAEKSKTVLIAEHTKVLEELRSTQRQTMETAGARYTASIAEKNKTMDDLRKKNVDAAAAHKIALEALIKEKNDLENRLTSQQTTITNQRKTLGIRAATISTTQSLLAVRTKELADATAKCVEEKKELNKTHTEGLEKNISDCKAQIATLTEEKDALARDYIARTNALLREAGTSTADVAKLQGEFDECKDNLNTKQTELTKAKKDLSDTKPVIDSLNASIVRLNARTSECNTTLQKKKDEITKVKKDLENTKAVVTSLRENVADLSASRAKIIAASKNTTDALAAVQKELVEKNKIIKTMFPEEVESEEQFKLEKQVFEAKIITHFLSMVESFIGDSYTYIRVKAGQENNFNYMNSVTLDKINNTINTTGTWGRGQKQITLHVDKLGWSGTINFSGKESDYFGCQLSGDFIQIKSWKDITFSILSNTRPIFLYNKMRELLNLQNVYVLFLQRNKKYNPRGRTVKWESEGL